MCEAVSSSIYEAFPRTRANVFNLPWLFCIPASHFFNFFFSSDHHFPSDKFSFGSFWPFLFVFNFVFSLCPLSCLPRNASTSVFYYLAILAKNINISPSASNGMRALFLCRQSCWLIRTRSRSWHFESSNRIQWIPFVLRKTLFDFIKSCGSQIRLKFSEVALLGLLYSPK